MGLKPRVLQIVFSTTYCGYPEQQVQEQILGFTSGTSQSHNRIKRDDLLKIRIPIPTTEAMKKEFKKVSEALEKAMNALYHGTTAKREQEEKIRKLLY